MIVIGVVMGCVNIPPFQNRDAGIDLDACGSGGPLRHIDEGGLQVICGPNYAMRFSAVGAHYPTSWLVNGHELISSGDGTACVDEQGMGIGLYPAGLLNGDLMPLQPAPTYEMAGVAVIKLALSWIISFSSIGDFVGRSTFTFYPDGRINRADYITTSTSTTNASSTCGANPWRITSFQVLPRDAVTFQNDPNIPNLNAEFPISSELGGGETYACALCPLRGALRWAGRLAAGGFAMSAMRHRRSRSCMTCKTRTSTPSRWERSGRRRRRCWSPPPVRSRHARAIGSSASPGAMITGCASSRSLAA
ncbi:MAG: hypothetical protein NT062_23405 [Proteobacteria bacterium]|nr:hypothetical protein [Pseudomonadota bacterium]